MSSLRLSNFGLQGVIGEALTPDIVIDFAAAYGTYLDGAPVMVGRDTRQSSRMLHAAVLSGLMSTGTDVIDLDICPTPMLQFAAMQRDVGGAIAISGGHNRVGMNGMVLIGSDGGFVNPVAGEAVLDIYHARDFRRRRWDQSGNIRQSSSIVNDYFAVLGAFVDTDAIRQSKFRVIVDPVNGAGCRCLEPFAACLGIEVIPINAIESGYPAHDVEPRPRNSRQVAALVPHILSDIGFVSSSDMGRIAIVAETGETASEEYTLPLIADYLLARQSGTLVTNCCTTRILDDVAARHEARIVKSSVGQAYVISTLTDESGILGGEGNGSVAIPEFNRAFDGFVSMAIILEAMALHKTRASELIRDLPRYHMTKRKLPAPPHRCYRAMEGLEHLAEFTEGGTISTQDGIRVDWEDGWIHVRASQTEPMIRIISESKSRIDAEARAVNAARLIEEEL